MQPTTDDHFYADEQLTSNAGGLPQSRLMTYIRPLQQREGAGFAVCSEQGTVLACFPNYDAAYYTARQFHLLPQALH